MIPQIIYIFLLLANLVLAGYNHGKEKNPKWFEIVQIKLLFIKASIMSNTFETIIGTIKDKYNNEYYDIPQLKDEFNTSDFGNYMIKNSLILNKK